MAQSNLMSDMFEVAENHLFPEGEERVPINIHPDTRNNLRNFLMERTDGEGYSEFIDKALILRRLLENGMKIAP